MIVCIDRLLRAEGLVTIDDVKYRPPSAAAACGICGRIERETSRGNVKMPQITESTLRGLVDRHYQTGGIPARYFYLVYMQVGCQGPAE